MKYYRKNSYGDIPEYYKQNEKLHLFVYDADTGNFFQMHWEDINGKRKYEFDPVLHSSFMEITEEEFFLEIL